jgi:hypothetical protein
LVLFTYTTKAGIVARATTKEAVRQPVFLLSMAVAILILLINTVLPFYSLGDDVKMLKDCSLATILISGLLIAVWTASTSIAEEIEGKTAMTLLSKPINRRQFILGKYIGILQAVLWFMLPIVIVFLSCVYFRVGYDAKEGSKDIPPAAIVMAEVIQVIPGLVLLFMDGGESDDVFRDLRRGSLSGYSGECRCRSDRICAVYGSRDCDGTADLGFL